MSLTPFKKNNYSFWTAKPGPYFLKLSFLHTPRTFGGSWKICMQKYIVAEFPYYVHLIRKNKSERNWNS